MKSILFNNACVITAHFLLFAWVLLFSKKSQGSLLFLHCSIFKMLFSFLPFEQCSFSIISHLQPFVKYFFQVFLKNFFSTLDLRCLSSDSLSIISHLSEFVNLFFKFLWKKFFRCDFLDFCVVLSDKYYYITSFSICQAEDCPNFIFCFGHFHQTITFSSFYQP